jgi:hypothetical protein
MIGRVLALTLAPSLTVGDLIVGIGTLALAGFTGWLGSETRQSARAAQAAVESAEEPFVIATPTDDYEHMTLRDHEVGPGLRPPLGIHRAGEPGNVAHFVRLKLWNIGSGPAIVYNVALTDHDGGEFLDLLRDFQPIAAGQAADVEVPSPAWPTDDRVAVMTVRYIRASGAEYETVSDAMIAGRLVACRTYERTGPKPQGRNVVDGHS